MPRLMKLHKKRKTVTANMTIIMISLRTTEFSSFRREALLLPERPEAVLREREEAALFFEKLLFKERFCVEVLFDDPPFEEPLLFPEEPDLLFLFPLELPVIYELRAAAQSGTHPETKSAKVISRLEHLHGLETVQNPPSGGV